MTLVGRIFANTATKWAAFGVRAVIGVLLVPFLISEVGRDGYGLLSVIATTVTFALLADLGLSTALSRHLADKAARNDETGFNSYFTSALLVYAGLGVAAGGLIFILADPLASLFGIPDKFAQEAGVLLRVHVPLMLLMTFVSAALGAVAQALHRFDIINMRNAAVGVVQGVALFAVLGLTSAAIYGWMVVLLATELIRLFVTLGAARRLRPTLRVGPALVKRVAVSDLFSFGWIISATQIASMIGTQVHPLLISRYLGLGAVALYSPAVSLTVAVRPLIDALATQLHSVATELHATNDQERLRQLLFRGTKYTMLMAAPVATVLVVLAEPIARVWLSAQLGPEHATTAQLIRIWALIDLLTYAAGSQWAVAMAMRKMTFYFWVVVPPNLAAVGVAALLLQFTTFGLYGAVFPLLIVKVLQRPICTWYAAKLVGVSTGAYVHAAYARPLIAMGILVLPTTAWAVWGPELNLVGLLLTAAAVILLWAPLCWWVGMQAADRASVGKLGRSVQARVPFARLRPPSWMRSRGGV